MSFLVLGRPREARNLSWKVYVFNINKMSRPGESWASWENNLQNRGQPHVPKSASYSHIPWLLW